MILKITHVREIESKLPCVVVFFALLWLFFFLSFRKRTSIINDRQRLMNPERKGMPIINNIYNKNEKLIYVLRIVQAIGLALTVRVTAFQT